MKGKELLRSLAPFLILAAALLILYPMDLAPGRFLVTYDAANFAPWDDAPPAPSFNPDCLQSYYPRRVLSREALLAGRIPLWDPTSFCGQPFLANFQSGVFYPVNLLLLPLSAERALGAYVWLHLLLAAVGMYLFLSSIRVSSVPSLAGALLFAANGALAVRTGQSTMLATPAWIPLLLFLAGRVARGGNPLPLALAWTCMVLSGFPPILAYGALLILPWALWCWWPGRKERGGAKLLSLAGGFALGTGMAAAQLLPTLEFISQSGRIRFAYETLLSSSWHPAMLIRLLLPRFFGSPLDGTDWFHLLSRGNGHYFQSFISTGAYAGAGTLLLAAAGAAVWRSSRTARFFLFAGGTGALVLFGTPLLRVVSLVPGLGGARVDRVVHIPVIALVVLASIGLDRAARGETARRTLIAGWAVLLLAGVGLTLMRDSAALALAGPPVLPYLARLSPMSGALLPLAFLTAVAFVVVFAAGAPRRGWMIPLAAILLVGDAAIDSRRCHVTMPGEKLPRETPGVRFLVDRSDRGRVVRYEDDVLPPSLPGLFGVSDVAGYNALTIRSYRGYYAAMAPPSVKERRINPLKAVVSVHSPLLDRVAGRWVISACGTTPPDLPVMYDAEMTVFENEDAYPRAYLTYRLAAVNSPRQAFELLSNPSTPRLTTTLEREEVHLEKDEKKWSTVGSWLDAHGGAETSFAPADRLDDRVRFVVDEPERIVIDCASRGGRMLVLSDCYYPGWVATVDGEETPIHRVNRTVRGVVLPAGVHRVEFRYDPPSFRRGVAVSLGSLLIAAAAALLSLRRAGEKGSLRKA